MLKVFFEWFTNVFAIDEKKSSTLALVVLLFCTLAAWKLFRYGDISDNFTSFLLGALGIFAGINVKETISEVITEIIRNKGGNTSA